MISIPSSSTPHHDTQCGWLPYEDWGYGTVPMDAGLCGGYHDGACHLSAPHHGVSWIRAPLEMRSKQHRLQLYR